MPVETRESTPPEEVYNCKHCGNPIQTYHKGYCSRLCYNYDTE